MAFLIWGVAVTASANLFQLAPEAMEAAAPSRPVARVNGVAVTEEQVGNVVRQLLAQHRHSIPPEQRGEAQEALIRQGLDLLIGRELLAQESARKGIDITRDELNTTLDGLRDNLPEGQTLERALRNQGLTRANLEANLIRELRVNRLIEQVGADLPEPTSPEVRSFYHENTEQFDLAESLSVRHILIGVMNSDSENVRTVRRRKAEALRRQVVDGQDFANLAMLHSDDATRTDGGEVGFVTRDRMQSSLADAAFSLRENEVSDVIESPAGYHIMQVLERRPARRIPLDEAEDQIRAFLSEQARETAVQELVSRLREQADIEILRGP